MVAVALISPGAWVILGQYAYYNLGIKPAMYLMPVFEIPLFLAILAIALVTAGFRVPFVTGEGEVRPGKYDLL